MNELFRTLRNVQTISELERLKCFEAIRTQGLEVQSRKLAYEWIKTGKWNLKDFLAYLEASKP